jgi:hypothetical protein
MQTDESLEFSGNIFIFHAFDIAEDIDIISVEKNQLFMSLPLSLPKYFKNYHTPLSIELPHPQSSLKCIGAKIHNFGVVSLTYKIPFAGTFADLKERLADIDSEYQEESVFDANLIYKKCKPYLKQPRFFHLRTSYVVIQIDQHEQLSATDLKEKQGGTIASLLRFETESLSEYIKNDILDAATGYYRGDLVVIDTDSALVYDDDYEELLPLVEFANIQRLELQYYDRSIDNQLNLVYQRGTIRQRPWKVYLPFIGSFMRDPVSDLELLKVDISVIIEQIESNIKISGDPYISDIYQLLTEKLDLLIWKESISNKLTIIKDIYAIHQGKIDEIREDMLTVLIIMLIFIELIVGILSYLK